MRSKRPHPITRLAISMGAAARNIEKEWARKIAARDAASIPKSRVEIGGGKRGELARMGRALMASLPDLPPEQLAEAATVLRGCADAIGEKFVVTNETTFGRGARHKQITAA